MLTINDDHYSEDDFEQQYQYFSTMSVLSTVSQIAVCLEDNMTWLAFCFYAKKHQLSVMPIHPSIPLDTAKKLATKAGCNILFYHTLDNIHQLENNSSSNSPAGLIQMSSGTTGDPKYIQRSWADIEIEINSYVTAFTQPQTKTPIIACPVTHSYGLIPGVMVALARGQSPIIITNINPKYLIKTLLRYEEPLLYSSPTMLEGLMRLWPAGKKLHAAMTSGTIMNAPVFEMINKRITHLYQQYGCSEAGCICICQKMTHANDIGTPLPHVSVSCSADADNPSEIVVQVNSDNQIQTIHTQDLGYIEKNEAGETNLRFTARLDDTIIVAGLNVYPQEIEDIILTHPKITDAVVFKIDDRFAGHRVCLQYQSNETLDAPSIRQWCREKLASFQIPQNLQQVSTIERLANGKVNRKKIAIDFLNTTEKREAQTSAVSI